MPLLINPSDLKQLIQTDEAVMIGLHPFSHSMNCIFEDIESLMTFVQQHPKAYYLYLNHLIDQDKLNDLKTSLLLLDKTNLKIMFEDYAVLQLVQELNLNIELILAGKNSITSAGLINQSEDQIKMALVSNDLALPDLNQLMELTTKPLIIHGLRYENIYYSKRPVVSNYLNTFNIEPKINYYLRLKDKADYPIFEAGGYSYIYSDKLFNIINLIPSLKLKTDTYLLLNSYLMDPHTFEDYIQLFKEVLTTNKEVPLPEDSSNYQLTNPNYYKVKADA